jgi:hypothetical protein
MNRIDGYSSTISIDDWNRGYDSTISIDGWNRGYHYTISNDGVRPLGMYHQILLCMNVCKFSKTENLYLSVFSNSPSTRSLQFFIASMSYLSRNPEENESNILLPGFWACGSK